MLTYAGRSTDVVTVSFTVRIWRTMTLTVSTGVIRGTPSIKRVTQLWIRWLVEIKKEEISYGLPSLAAVVISVPHSTNCSPLCATEMKCSHFVLISNSPSFNLSLFLSKVLPTCLESISSHRCTRHHDRNRLRPVVWNWQKEALSDEGFLGTIVFPF